MKSTVSRLLETEQLISSKEKEVAMARFERLLLIAGAATAERFTALELGDTEEANLLLAEAEAANTEAKKLQPIFNFNEEQFPNLPKHFLSMELVYNLGRRQLEELAASVGLHHNDQKQSGVELEVINEKIEDAISSKCSAITGSY